MKLTNEAKVGILVSGCVILIVVFGWLIGVKNPFERNLNFYLTYNFAGGIEVGSPVRVSGIKVGRVEEVHFFEEIKKGTTPAPVTLLLSVKKEATRGIRQDSQFFINMAGIIGERYLEVVPGTAGSDPVHEGDLLIGRDPPRVDQLISQSFDLAGKIMTIVEENKGDFTKTIRLLSQLSANFNDTITKLNESKMFDRNLGKILDNFDELAARLNRVSKELEVIAKKANGSEVQKTFDLLNRLIWRMEPLDAQAIKSFFQDEGIRARLF